jgi:hypothetical protein
MTRPVAAALSRLPALAAAGLACFACLTGAVARPVPVPPPAARDPSVVQLEAAYRPIAKINGPDRARRACADRDKLRTAVSALPKAAPAGSPIDGDAWHTSVGGLALAVENFAAACQAPDLKVHHISGEVETADACLSRVDEEVQIVLDAARPRDLLPAMKRFQAALQRVVREPGSKQLCARRDELAKLLAGLVESPPRADTQKWEQAHARAARNLDQIKANRCRGHRGAEVELADAITQVHDGFYQLVLLLPPRDE